MVLFDLSVLARFGAIVAATPSEVSKRKLRLTEVYNNLKSDNIKVVSIRLSSNLERLRECHIDFETKERRQQIIDQLIEDFTNRHLNLDTVGEFKIFLVPQISSCLNPVCSSSDLKICRPNKAEHSVTVYCVDGIREGEVYRKECWSCKRIYFYNYMEDEDSCGNKIRSYYNDSASKQRFFSITNETFFEKKLLDYVTEEIVVCNVQFTNWVVCYNRLNNSTRPVSYKLLIPVWLIYHMWKRMDLTFPVVRDNFRNLDVEKICEHLYPKLRELIDRKWISHVCDKCTTRIVILDGNAKVISTLNKIFRITSAIAGIHI